MKAVYIHGFAGSIHSDTITNFRKYYPDLDWCPLEVNHHVEESVKKINDFIRTFYYRCRSVDGCIRSICLQRTLGTEDKACTYA